MFTKNWYKILTAKIHQNSSIRHKTWTNALANTDYSQGRTLDIDYNYDAYYLPTLYKMRNSADTYGGIIIGTGTTPPTPDDYCFSGDIITTFTGVCSVTSEYTDNGVVYTAVCLITNTGDTAFTIGEIGLVTNAYYNYNNQNSKNYKCLIERTVLDSPLTIEPGGVGRVTYTIRMNYPTA